MHPGGEGDVVAGRQAHRDNGQRRLRRFLLRQFARGWGRLLCRSVPCPRERLARLCPGRKRLSGRTEVDSIRRDYGGGRMARRAVKRVCLKPCDTSDPARKACWFGAAAAWLRR